MAGVKQLLKLDVITIFPGMFSGPFGESILKRAQDNKLLQINIHNLRDFTHNKHSTVDDTPFGGGAGMLMKPEPFFEAVETICANALTEEKKPRVIMLCPQGKRFDQEMAKEFAREDRLIFLCGHYEGIDERVREYLATDEVSIGDFVLTGGELPAMVMIDAVARMIPGVLKEWDSLVHDSFYNGMLDYPQYTRPRKFRDWEVPEILLSGNHAKIEAWRREKALERTQQKRPDLLLNLDTKEANRGEKD